MSYLRFENFQEGTDAETTTTTKAATKAATKAVASANTGDTIA
ncbi:hypothetical protein [Coprobacter sp.]